MCGGRARAMRRWSAVAIGLALLALPSCGGGPPNPYPPEIVEAFVTACRTNAPESVCRCAIDRVQRRFSLDEYLALEKRITNGDIPKELVDEAAECRGR